MRSTGRLLAKRIGVSAPSTAFLLEYCIMKARSLVLSAFLAMAVAACGQQGDAAVKAAQESAKKAETAVAAATEAAKTAASDTAVVVKESVAEATLAAKEASKEMVIKAADATSEAADKAKEAVSK
jgi:hypothetical protein